MLWEGKQGTPFLQTAVLQVLLLLLLLLRVQS
jgi:hypothetical protein